MHSSTLDHRTRFFEPCKTIFPLLSLSPRLERIRRVGGGEEGKVEIRRIGRARVKSSRRFELFRGGCFERYWRAQVRAERSAADNEEMEEASRRGDEKTHVFRAYVSWRCLPATSRSLRPRRHVLDFFARNSNRVLMQRRGNKNSIFLGQKSSYKPAFLDLSIIILLLFITFVVELWSRGIFF